MDNTRKHIIAVIGGRQAPEHLQTEAFKVGSLIARAGCILITGGLGGIMEAACQGAKEEGGQTLGILPGEFRDSANPYVDVPVATGFGIGRNVIIARTADALIAVGGQYGTLSEVAYALQMGKHVVGIGTWDIEGVEVAADAMEAARKVLERLGFGQ